jgi:hypothetical protein
MKRGLQAPANGADREPGRDARAGLSAQLARAGWLPLCFLGGSVYQAGGPAISVACLAGGNDQYAVMGFVLEVE